jgi:serine protease
MLPPDHAHGRARLAVHAGLVGALVASLGCASAVASPSPPGPVHHWGVVPPRSGAPVTTANGPLSAATSASAATGADTLSFGGTLDGVGVVTGQPKVYLVFWGDQWGVPGTAAVQGTGSYTTFSGDPDNVAPVLQAFFAGLGTDVDGWSGNLTQYCQSSATVTVSAGAASCAAGATPVGNPLGGALAGVWEDNAGPAPAAAGPADLAAEAERAAGHFGNTTTAANRNALYVVVSPTKTTPDGFNTTPSGGFCAWHDDTEDAATNSVTPQTDGLVAFVNLPYLPDAGASCGAGAVNAGGTDDGVTIVGGHEYAEWLTDPIPGGGWYNTTTGAESADECAWLTTSPGAMTDIALATGTFPVQSVWSNANNACETTGIAFANASPTRTGTVGAPLAGTASTAIDPYTAGSLTYTATGLPAGVSIDPSTGRLVGTPAAALSGQPSLITATDPAGIASAITVLWNIAPAPTAPPGGPGGATVSIDAPGRVVTLQTAFASVGVAAADSARNQTLSFRAAGLPAGLAINPASGRISGRVTGAPGTYRVRVSVRDTTGASTSVTVVWVVESPLALTLPAAQSTARHRTARLRLRVRELIAHRTVRFRATGLPAGLRINARTGVVGGVITGVRGTYAVIIVVTDSGGARTTGRLVWRVR